MTILLSIALIVVSMLALCLWCCLFVASEADDKCPWRDCE